MPASPVGQSVLESVRQRLIEVELGSRVVEVELRGGLSLGEIRGTARSVVGGLVEEEVTLRRPACRGEGRWPVGQTLPHAMHALRGGPRSRCTRMERTTGGSVRKARILI